MVFTYEAYRGLLRLLADYGYEVRNYGDYSGPQRCVILRHDIDYEPADALTIGKIERDMSVKSTFFVLMTSELYNPYAPKTADILKKLRDMGHEIGLHFDEKAYGHGFDALRITEEIAEEAAILGQILSAPVTAVSMHRPSRESLEHDIEIPGLINTYSKEYFRDFKYLSDSRRRWREPAEDIIRSERFSRLHILTHPFWYGETETSLAQRLNRFLSAGNADRYRIMKDNFTDLDSAMKGV